MELTEAKKIAEERRREKMEDRMARQRVKEQIARDHAEREGQGSDKVQPSVQGADKVQLPGPQQMATANSNVKKHNTCRLQIRCVDGKTMIETFQATDTFQEVLSKTGLSTHVLMTTFPKKLYTDDDGPKTLEELGIVIII